MISETKTRRVLSLIIPLIMSLVLVASSAILPAQAGGEPQEEMEKLQQWVYDQGYNYTVGENWVTGLSPEERETLCGYRGIEAPEGPLPENLGFFPGVPTMETQKLGQPSSYDAMALGHVTPVKDQGPCGSCWIFAAVADLESTVAIGETSLLDFSEQEVGDCNVWSAEGGYNFCLGGNAFMTTNHLTQYGAADETCHPYAATPQTCLSCPALKNVDNWRMITGAGGATETTTIKNAILDYGPVFSSMYASGPGFAAYHSGVYEYWGTESPDHAIQIIGWDDMLEHSQGFGAWLIKNSWGTGWGAGHEYPGCAWVAYGSANLGHSTSAIAGYADPLNTIFYHDECGWMGFSYGTIDATAYGAVRFTPTQNLTLTAVDFWAVDASMSYEIKIFDTLTDLGGGNYSFSDQLGTTQTGTTDEPGYYSIPLDTPVPLTTGDDFIVQVKLTRSAGWPIPIDYCTVTWLPPWPGIATFSGESYYSTAGVQFTKPFVNHPPHYTGNVDVGIRARAQSPALAVTPPGYDSMQEVLDAMGRAYVTISLDQLADYPFISQFEVVFINCSWDLEPIAEAAAESLRQYVEEGGVVYASDWAHTFLENSFPEYATFVGYVGEDGWVEGQILDAGLAHYMESDTILLHFDLGAWVPIEEVSPEVTVYIEGEVTYWAPMYDVSGDVKVNREGEVTYVKGAGGAVTTTKPIVIRFVHGSGSVVYTSFHHRAQGPEAMKLMEYLALIPITESLAKENKEILEGEGFEVIQDNRGLIDPGQTVTYTYEATPGETFMIVLNWPGSTMKLSVHDPDGYLYEEVQSDTPPISITVAQAASTYTYSVTAIDVPYSGYEYAVAVGKKVPIEVSITGVTGEVNCELLGDVLVELFENDTLIASTNSSAVDGSYSLTGLAPGTYRVVASKDGFRTETQTVEVVPGENPVDFRGETGLIPNEVDIFYVLGCIDNWLYPPSEECELSLFRALAVIDAWLYPV